MLQDAPKVKPNLEEIQWSKEKEKNQKEKRTEINFVGFIRVVCWKNSMKWIRNWYFLCSLEDVIISGEKTENPWVPHWKW